MYIPKSITTIRDQAIREINTLTDVYICAAEAPASGTVVFSRTSTENITLHVQTSAIDSYKEEPWPTFKDIVALTSDEIAKSESNDDEYIELTGNVIVYTTDTETKTAEVTGAVLKDSKLVIPSTVDKDDVTYTVTGIGEQAFSFNTKIESVTLPSTITYLGRGAFRNCDNLKEINLPEGLKSIDDQCFVLCPQISVVTLPNSLESIGRAAFGGMPHVSFTIPAGVKEIGPSAFNGAAAIKVAAENPVYDSRDDCNAVVETATNTIVSVAASTETIPNGIEEIGIYCFNGYNGAQKLYVPATVTYIGLYNFIYCEGLTDVYLYAMKVPRFKNDDRSRHGITLHVPASALNDYTSAWQSLGFDAIVAMTDEELAMGIESVELQRGNIQSICDLSGRHQTSLRKGLNIVTLSNGRTTKVVCK